uniref:Uncharacterized protein n=1 Tax=Anaerobacillus isosaccharinicus TaxID=1532552 RepID=A0A1S2L1D7_9BACI
MRRGGQPNMIGFMPFALIMIVTLYKLKSQSEFSDFIYLDKGLVILTVLLIVSFCFGSYVAIRYQITC